MSYRQAFVLGAITGIRSTAALAAVDRRARWLALGEAIADKLPFIPPRTRPSSLVARAASAAFGGYRLARKRRQRLLFAALSATTACLAAFAATRLRRSLTHKWRAPDVVIGVLEDVVVTLGNNWTQGALR